MKRPAISVIIPVYNAEKYLRECLESVQNQTFKDLEVICVNDGSTDGSLDILKDFAKNDKRFVIIDQKNRGVNVARAEGYKKASGKYITCIDSDDFLEINAYEEMVKKAEDNNCDIVICNYNFFPKKIQNKDVWYRPYVGKNDWRFIARNTVPWNKIIKSDLVKKTKVSKLFLMMGENAFAIMLASTNKILTIDTPLYNYRVGHESFSTNYNNVAWFERVVLDNYTKYIYAQENKLQKDIQNYFFYSYLYYNLILMAVASKNSQKKIYYDAKKILKKNRYFSNNNTEFFKSCLSAKKRFFLRWLIYPNYYLSKIISWLVLR